jgi:hypothetical protein
MSTSEQYAHVLLFACPACERPISATYLSTHSNLESAEAESFTLHCHCGWAGKLTGVSTVKHLVESWRREIRLSPSAEGSCDGNSLNRVER